MSGFLWNQFRKASKSSATLFNPLGQHVRAFEARGEDLTVAARNEFIQTQKELFPYRVAKLKQEIAYMRSNQFGGISLATFSVKDAFGIFRFWTRVLAVFAAAVMVGRMSYFPLLEPGSPFIDGLKYQNPNRVLPQYRHLVQGDSNEEIQ